MTISAIDHNLQDAEHGKHDHNLHDLIQISTWQKGPMTQSSAAATPTTFMPASRSAPGGRAKEEELRRRRPSTGDLTGRQLLMTVREKEREEGPEPRRWRATRFARWDDVGPLA